MSAGTLPAHDAWVHDTIQAVFRLSLVAQGTSKYTVLQALEANMGHAQVHPQGGHVLTTQNMEVALAECLSLQTDAAPYMHECWERAKKLLDDEPNAPSHKRRLDCLQEINDLAVAYFSLSVGYEDLFASTCRGGEKLLNCLVGSSNGADLIAAMLKAQQLDAQQVPHGSAYPPPPLSKQHLAPAHSDNQESNHRA